MEAYTLLRGKGPDFSSELELADHCDHFSRLVMGDNLPREIENPLYRYLIAISKLRLGILTEQGEGS